jgi:hypothetical protein
MNTEGLKRKSTCWTLFLLAFGFLSVGLPGTLHAGTIGPSCGSCFGSVYTLSDKTISLSALADTYQITLTVDTALTDSAQYYLNSVAVKTTPNTSDILSISTVTLPSGFIGKTIGGLDANGCKSGSAGFGCATYLSATSGLLTGSATYTFQYDESIVPGTLLTGTDAASIKALYLNVDGTHDGITSENITLSSETAVPEPGTWILFGTGLLLMGSGIVTRKKHSAHA